MSKTRRELKFEGVVEDVDGGSLTEVSPSEWAKARCWAPADNPEIQIGDLDLMSRFWDLDDRHVILIIEDAP
jgi:hypothetical protein